MAFPLWFWIDRLVARWAALPDGGSSAWAGRFAGRVLVAVAVVIGLCLTEYVVQSQRGDPVAGLGTVAGHPTDRPRLSPWQMRYWERKNGIIEPGAGVERRK